MKKIFITVALLVFACLSFPSLCTAGKNGFGDLNFGDSKERVVSYLREKYATEEYAEGNVMESDDYVWLHNFELGDKLVEVTFFFDHNEKLYSFQFASEKVGADDFNYQLRDDAFYFNEVFIKRFGKPYKKFTPNFLSVSSNSIAYLNKWNNKDLDIYTGVTSFEFRYYAVASVTSKKMEKALEQYRKKVRLKSSREAVDSF